jgi:hypothetical protein
MTGLICLARQQASPLPRKRGRAGIKPGWTRDLNLYGFALRFCFAVLFRFAVSQPKIAAGCGFLATKQLSLHESVTIA